MTGNDQTEETEETDTAPTRLDRAPWSGLHSRILLALGIGWALDSFEVQIIGSVLTPLAKDFGLLGADGAIAPWAVSVIWVVWFAGLMLGATSFGWLADRYGRKQLFVATLVMYSIATVISAFSPNFVVFLVFRFITGAGVGGEYSAVTSAIAEFMPVRRCVVSYRQIPLDRLDSSWSATGLSRRGAAGLIAGGARRVGSGSRPRCPGAARWSALPGAVALSWWEMVGPVRSNTPDRSHTQASLSWWDAISVSDNSRTRTRTGSPMALNCRARASACGADNGSRTSGW